MTWQPKIIVTRAGHQLHVMAPFGAKDLVKSIPGRRWDPTRRVWTVPADLEEDARLILDTWAGGVSYDEDAYRKPSAPVCVACRRPLHRVDLDEGFSMHAGCMA